MPTDRVLVIDAGTSSLRALAVAADGATVIVGVEPWDTHVPADAAPFAREFDAAAVETSLRRLLAAAEVAGDFAGIAFTGQREGLSFVADDGAALYVGPNVDARASAEGIETDARHGEEIYAATGHLPSLLQAPAKLSWLRRHRPDAAARVHRVLPLADWLASLVTHEPVMSRSLAAENGLLDLRSGAPPPYLPQLEFDAALLPPIVEDGAIAGSVREGSLSGTRVVLAGADTQCALGGMGALSVGDCAVPAGWSAPVQLVTAQPIFDAEMRTWTGLHVVPARFVLESNASETGTAWAWVCALMRCAPEDAAAWAATAPVGANDVMAVLGARVMRASAMSAGMGALTVPLPLVMSAPQPAELLRSVLESTAYAIRANLEQLEEIAATHIGLLRLGGGMSGMPLFARIVADVLDRRVEVARTPETTALGAAALASPALGLHPSLGVATVAMCGGRAAVLPDAAASAAYEDHYARWCAMADAFARIGSEGG